MNEAEKFDLKVIICGTSTNVLKKVYDKINDEWIKSAINCELIQRATDKITKNKQITFLDNIFYCAE